MEQRDESVLLITLNRAQVLNALRPQLVAELRSALLLAEANSSVRAIVITGGTKAFAAGADIGTMASMSLQEARASGNFIDQLGSLFQGISKP